MKAVFIIDDFVFEKEIKRVSLGYKMVRCIEGELYICSFVLSKQVMYAMNNPIPIYKLDKMNKTGYSLGMEADLIIEDEMIKNGQV